MRVPSSQRGFTLIEVLVSVFVFGSVVILLVGVFNLTLLTRLARQEDIALKIADHKLEELRNDGYAGLPASGSFSDSLLSSLPNSTASTSISDFNAKVKQVIVQVGWQAPSGSTRVMSLTTLITQSGGLQ